jgi:hypothetical protein
VPLYLFENPNTGEIKEVLQSMTDIHEYSEDGISWKRVFLNPEVAFDSQIKDPFSKEEFLSKTANKKGKVGDWLDRSEELSRKRADKDGLDLVKEKYFEDYSKKRKGKQLLEVRKRKAKEKLDKMGVILE